MKIKYLKILSIIALTLVFIVLAITFLSKMILTNSINEAMKKIDIEEVKPFKISYIIDTYDQRRASFPLNINDEFFFNGKIKSMTITTSTLDGTVRKFTDEIQYNEFGNIIRSNSINDGTEYSTIYEYDDLQNLISTKLIEKNEIIKSKSYIYEYDEIDERDLYIECRNQNDNKFKYTEMIRYYDNDSIIRSDISESGIKKTIIYKVENSNITQINTDSEFYNLKETFQYNDIGMLIEIKHYRKNDILYLVNEFFYTENNLLEKVITTHAESNVSRESLYSGFDKYGNWQQVEHKDKNGKSELRITREMIYFDANI